MSAQPILRALVPRVPQPGKPRLVVRAQRCGYTEAGRLP